MTLSIRNLIESDLVTAGLISQAAYNRAYSLEPVLRRLLKLQPDGWYLALLDGEPVGLGGAVDYGTFAYLGMMSVLPTAQNRGAGAALMERILGWLDARGCPTVLLNARQRAVSLYERWGFAEIDQTLELHLPEHAPFPQELVEGISILTEDELPALAAFDAPAFGVARAHVLSTFFTENPGRFLVSRDSAGDLSGFLLAGKSSLALWHANSPDTAEKLLLRALPMFSTHAIIISLPASNGVALALCRRYGFEMRDTLPHMRRGQPLSRDPERHLYALAAHGLG